MLNFLIGFASNLLAVLVVLWIERQRRASIKFRILSPTVVPSGVANRIPCTWVQLEILNLPSWEWIRSVYTCEPALSCRAYIGFFRPCGEAIIPREMPARWSSSVEPRLETTEVGGKTFAYLRDSIATVDVHSNHPENIHPVVIFPEPLEVFGWTNESYAYGWKHPDWRIQEKLFVIRLRVTTADREFLACFRVDLTGGYENIKHDRLGTEFH